MTPKWPLTPDFFWEHVHPFPSNPVSFGDEKKMMKKHNMSTNRKMPRL